MEFSRFPNWTLNSTGNSLIVNTGLSDLVVTIVVIPISIVSLLAIHKDDEIPPLSVCKTQWFLAACTFVISVLTLAVSRAFGFIGRKLKVSSPQVTSIENYMRLCTSQDGSQWFGRSNVTAIILLVWFIGCVASSLQYVYKVSFDYCQRANNKKLLPIETGKGALCRHFVVSLTFHVSIHRCPSCSRAPPTCHHLARPLSHHHRRQKVHESAEL